MEYLYAEGPILTKEEGTPEDEKNKQPHRIKVKVEGVGERTFSLWKDDLYAIVKKGQHVYIEYYETQPKEGSQRKTPYMNIERWLDGPQEQPAHARPPSQSQPSTNGHQTQPQFTSQPATHHKVTDDLYLSCKALELAVQQSLYDATPLEITNLADYFLGWLRDQTVKLHKDTHCLLHRVPWEGRSKTGKKFHHDEDGVFCVEGLGRVNTEGQKVA